MPCIFYGDLYGIRANVKHRMTPACNGKLPLLTQVRKLYAHGEQVDYFDQPNCIGLCYLSQAFGGSIKLTVPRLCSPRRYLSWFRSRLHHQQCRTKQEANVYWATKHEPRVGRCFRPPPGPHHYRPMGVWSVPCTGKKC